MSDKKNIETWFNDVILLFRKEYQKLSEEEKRRIDIFWNFLSPCQIEIIQFNEPVYQIIIITHFTWENDMNIIVHESVPTHNAIGHFEEILKEERWQKELDDEDKRRFHSIYKNKTYGNVIEGIFLQIIQSIKGGVFIKYERLPQKLFGIVIMNNGFGQLVRGNITDRDTSTFVDELVKEAKSRVILSKQEQKPKPTEETFNGYGTYFYPPIWIEEIPQLTFREKIGVGGYLKYCKKSFDSEYDGKKIVLTTDGFIAIVSNDKGMSKRILNKIMAISLINDIPSETIRDNELEDVTISDEWEIKGRRWGGQPTMRTNIGMEEWQTSLNIELRRSKIDSNTLKAIIQQAEKIESSIDNSLLFLLETYTHLRHSEYPQSFLMSWLIIEEHLSEQWYKLLDDKNISGERKKELRKSPIHRIIEILNLADKLNNDDYRYLMNLKSKRNEISYGKEVEIKKDDADKCFNVAFSLLKEKIEVAE